MRILSIAAVAGAALFVAACGGGAANNTANAPAADNGTTMDNGMAPDMNAPMPADNTSMNSTTTTTTTPGGNTTTTTTNTTNAM
jgi:hypothetical protein